MTTIEELRAAVEAAKAEIKRLAGETRRARVALDDATAALDAASGPKLTPEQRTAEKQVAEEGKIAAFVGKDPELAMEMARALLAAGFVKGKKRIFSKGADGFRQLESGDWIRRAASEAEGWYNLQKPTYNWTKQENDPKPSLRDAWDLVLKSLV